MSDKITRLPQIRFAGFTDGWEQHSLSKVGNFLRTSVDPQATPRASFVEYSMPSYDNGRNPETVFGDSMQSMRLKISGDVLLINKLNVRQKRIWFVEDAPSNAVSSSEFMPFTSTEIDLAFLEQLMLSDKTTRDLESISSGTSNSQKRITPSDVLKYLIKLPVDRPEQEKIGSFFKNIDNLIKLHQRKLELLKDTKKSLLQKMFPKDGADVPEIRFAGFTDAWEQRVFSDVLDFSISNNTLSRAGLNYDQGEVKNIHYGDILVKYDSIVDINSEDVPWVTDGKPEDYKNQWLQNGDVIIADTAEDETTGKVIEVTGITNKYAVSGLHTMVARPNQEFAPKYLGYYLNSPAYHNKLLPLMQGIKVLSLSKANIAKTNVAFPKEIEEQAKIGSFFENLDNLITLHKSELNSLKNLKKSLLQQLFI
ncbi:restriction endonuclease subunit S [Bacillus altitudinis]|uniref:restriction endonuclease subunit S n=1 Tax=Bacillus altitudinis TaxID=293387 RepID=UPI0033158993